MNDNNSGVNTVLIVIVLVVVVGALMWYFSRNTGVNVPAPTQEEPGLNVDVNLPTGEGGQGGAEQGGTAPQQ